MSCTQTHTHTHTCLFVAPQAITWASQSRRTATCAVSCGDVGGYRPRVIADAARAHVRVQPLGRACSSDTACPTCGSRLGTIISIAACTFHRHRTRQTIVVTALDPGLEAARQRTLPGPPSVCAPHTIRTSDAACTVRKGGWVCQTQQTWTNSCLPVTHNHGCVSTVPVRWRSRRRQSHRMLTLCKKPPTLCTPTSWVGGPLKPERGQTELCQPTATHGMRARCTWCRLAATHARDAPAERPANCVTPITNLAPVCGRYATRLRGSRLGIPTTCAHMCGQEQASLDRLVTVGERSQGSHPSAATHR